MVEIAGNGTGDTDGGTGDGTNSAGDGGNNLFGGFEVVRPVLGGDGEAAPDPAAPFGRKPNGQPYKRRPNGTAGSIPRTEAAPKRRNALDLSGIEKILLSGHAMLASLVKTPEIEIDAKEAEKLAEGIQGVARHYVTLSSGVTADWINLFMALGIIYGPRIYAVQARQKRKAVTEAEPNVFALHPAE